MSGHRRVKSYCVHFTNAHGRVETAMKDFNSAQCDYYNTVLEKDGISITRAIEIVKHWNILGKNKYTYSVPFCKLD